MEIVLVKFFLKAMGIPSFETQVLHCFKYSGRNGVVQEIGKGWLRHIGAIFFIFCVPMMTYHWYRHIPLPHPQGFVKIKANNIVAHS